MSSKRLRFITIAGALFVALAVGISVLVAKLMRETYTMDMPETQVGVSDAQGSQNDSDADVEYIEVTVDNVQAVIAKIQRSVSYSRKLQVINYYGEESADYEIEVRVLEEAKSIKLTGAGYTKNIIFSGDMLYVWEDGDDDYYKAAPDASENDDKLTDMFQMMLTYEDVLELEPSQITNAEYAELNGEMCIVVGYFSQQLGYETICYISAEKGLIVEAEQYDGDTRIYHMSASDFTNEVLDDTPFDLPDGTNALTGI